MRPTCRLNHAGSEREIPEDRLWRRGVWIYQYPREAHALVGVSSGRLLQIQVDGMKPGMKCLPVVGCIQQFKSE